MEIRSLNTMIRLFIVCIRLLNMERVNKGTEYISNVYMPGLTRYLRSLSEGTRVRTLLLTSLDGVSENGLDIPLEGFMMASPRLESRRSQRRRKPSNTWRRNDAAEVTDAVYTCNEINALAMNRSDCNEFVEILSSS